ncbi:hypothetical protein [Saccharothrix texasensis]|uniref:Uncharacterized protein n=1 Tax=Saccharothrix texasensis TaxID=103734 RepID=A0A3N1H9B7_9PSEU|nr:hypothetical protein [Saccharothrix texasensis]ROP39109.1 hypothetical protein EDD40_4483 [Saccharothrix texasensis]
MSDRVMHIAGDLSVLAFTVGLTNNPKSLCGVRIQGAREGAPLCPACFRRSGWTYDKRHR